jgi:long-chain acyl-CoA synthetase
MIASGGPRPEPGTLNRLFFDAIARFGKPDALLWKSEPGKLYEPISHRSIEQRVARIALALKDAGIASGDRVAILSGNRPEWLLCDFACLTSGLVTVPVYPTLPADQVLHILRDSGAALVFAADTSQVAKIAGIRAQLEKLKFVVTFAPEADASADATLREVEERGAELEKAAPLDAWRSAALAAQPDDVATIIYTSGTTGNPKGVMLTHDNLHSNCVAAAAVLNFGKETSLSILPLSHVFERMAGHFLMFSQGATIAYAESLDSVAANMLEIRPTFVLSVPRMYEKMYARILENARSGGRLKLAVFNWAVAVADRWAELKLSGSEPRGFLAAKYSLASKLVFSKLRERTGGRLRVFVSGGAPLAPEINRFFFAAGLTILEGYGLTETSPVLCVNTPDEIRIGTVGKPVAGVEVRIAADGEILARGPGIMLGYHNNPQATAEAIDADGWFHTGDIGELKDDFLSITDRKKDLIVTAGGKKIAPQPVENTIRNNEFVAEAVMIGDKRKFAVLLIVPDFRRLEEWARSNSITWTDHSSLIEQSGVRQKMESEVLGMLHGLARFEMPKKIALLAHEFSAEKGELTPSLKVKRRVIDAHYKDIIDGLYKDGEAA